MNNCDICKLSISENYLRLINYRFDFMLSLYLRLIFLWNTLKPVTKAFK